MAAEMERDLIRERTRRARSESVTAIALSRGHVRVQQVLAGGGDRGRDVAQAQTRVTDVEGKDLLGPRGALMQRPPQHPLPKARGWAVQL
ncbi:hypothetical protein ACFOWE_31070 [Planomonospora corallina]|uniref:Uncharacterized protein n=1 Tax=Planomonospora corallina TaxID=1806052 RepID=A0ABV8IIC6_9ACTN